MVDPDRSSWTHDQEMAWNEQAHVHELAKVDSTKELDLRKEDHQFELSRLEAGGDQSRRTRRQWVRFIILSFVVAIWLIQTAYITYHSVKDKEVLTDIEKYILLIGVTGGIVYLLVPKLWPERAETEEPKPNGRT